MLETAPIFYEGCLYLFCFFPSTSSAIFSSGSFYFSFRVSTFLKGSLKVSPTESNYFSSLSYMAYFEEMVQHSTLHLGARDAIVGLQK